MPWRGSSKVLFAFVAAHCDECVVCNIDHCGMRGAFAPTNLPGRTSRRMTIVFLWSSQLAFYKRGRTHHEPRPFCDIDLTCVYMLRPARRMDHSVEWLFFQTIIPWNGRRMLFTIGRNGRFRGINRSIKRYKNWTWTCMWVNSLLPWRPKATIHYTCDV